MRDSSEFAGAEEGRNLYRLMAQNLGWVTTAPDFKPDRYWKRGCGLDAETLSMAVLAMHHALVKMPPPGYEFDGIAEW